jgi:hypothetical protein
VFIDTAPNRQSATANPIPGVTGSKQPLREIDRAALTAHANAAVDLVLSLDAAAAANQVNLSDTRDRILAYRVIARSLSLRLLAQQLRTKLNIWDGARRDTFERTTTDMRADDSRITSNYSLLNE